MGIHTSRKGEDQQWGEAGARSGARNKDAVRNTRAMARAWPQLFSIFSNTLDQVIRSPPCDLLLLEAVGSSRGCGRLISLQEPGSLEERIWRSMSVGYSPAHPDKNGTPCAASHTRSNEVSIGPLSKAPWGTKIEPHTLPCNIFPFAFRSRRMVGTYHEGSHRSRTCPWTP